jgi:inhibitor of KinA sporulation pathway (predicted exonuclease)
MIVSMRLSWHSDFFSRAAQEQGEETVMVKRLDRILVIDLEATCWEGEPPPGQQQEIIEIGLCVLDVASTRRMENRSLLVRPVQSTVSAYCTALTTLTQEEVDQGVPLGEACRILEEQYRSKQRLWASYGDYDRHQFERNCQALQIPYPFGPGHLNVKTLFALAHGLAREVRLDKAMSFLGFPMEGTHHRGADDAWNIARILGDLLIRARNGRRSQPTRTEQ